METPHDFFLKQIKHLHLSLTFLSYEKTESLLLLSHTPDI